MNKVEKKLGLHIASIPLMFSARESYKLLLVFNYRGFASRISRGSSEIKTNIENTWYNLGGDIDRLWKNADKGKNKKPLMCGKKCKDKIPTDAKVVSANGVNDVESYYYPSVFYNEPWTQGWNYNGADGQPSFSVPVPVNPVSSFGDTEVVSPTYDVQTSPTTATSMLLQKFKPNPDDAQFFNCIEPGSGAVCTVGFVVAQAAGIIAALAGIVNMIAPKPDEVDELGSDTTAALESVPSVPANIQTSVIPTTSSYTPKNTSTDSQKRAGIIGALVVGGFLITILSFSLLSKK